jgi:hypothetical protein
VVIIANFYLLSIYSAWQCLYLHYKEIRSQTQQKGSNMTEETNALLKQILEELKAIRKEVAPTRTKKITHTANISGKTITECVTDGVSSAIQKSIRDIDEADS